MVNIDLEKIIAEKNPQLAKRMPRFFIKIIKRLLHLDEINSFLARNEFNPGIDNVKSFIKELNVTFTVHGIEHLKNRKRIQFACNHPLGALDGITLLSVVYDEIGETRFLVNDLLLKLEIFAPLLIPVNTLGSTSKDIAQKIDQAYASENNIIIFPAGMASRKIKGKVIDLEWKKSFVQKSIEHQRDIIPVFFHGKNSWFFYWCANVRKRLGIKANIEMFFLPNEMYKKRNAHFEIYFGAPIPWTELKNQNSPRQWTIDIRKIVYSLRM